MFARSLLLSTRTYQGMRLNYSSNPQNFVYFLDNMAVCWHPEPKFPYECSRPLPPPKPVDQSVLKITEEEAYKVWTPPQKPAVIAEEMARKTYTCKHRWFPRARDKRAKKTKPDRPYL